jgi:hypothetical protein
MKRIAMGVVWFLIFWIGAQFLFGLAIGFKEGFNDEANGRGTPSSQELRAETKSEMAPYAPWIAFGSLILAVAGTATGVLPGTRRRKDKGDVS